MKKIILGAFFTAALVVVGTTNVNAQSANAVKGEKATNAVLKEKATINKSATLKAAPISNAKAVPAKLKPISKASRTAPTTTGLKNAKVKPVSKAMPINKIKEVKKD
jgi:hypothetical protein